MKIPVFLLLALALPGALQAELSLPRFFSDHMILQREREAMIRGTADPNAEVTISFKGATATAKADSEGKWRAAIATGAADATGAPLVITSGTE
jgi:sialate O-acetylesterase